jgi:HSP20 family molecular chaperone IbpA
MRAEQSVEQAELAANHELDQVRDQYASRSEMETARQEDAIEKQKNKGYERLRELKRAQEAEIHRVKREGERDLQKTSDYYRDTLYKSLRKGEGDLAELKQRQAREMNYVDQSGKLDNETAKTEQARKLAELKEDQEHQYQDLNSQAIAKYQKMKTDTEAANQRASEHFQEQYASTLSSDQTSYDNLQRKANSQLNSLRDETSQKLAAYENRQSDPFYKLKDLGAELHEYEDKFVLTASIPAHEQKHVSVSVKGNQLMISGNRRNEEHLDLGPGRSKGSASYESFEESFPLSWPVDRNQLKKEFHGDKLIVTVPKQNAFAFKDVYKAPAPARLRAERPHFPGNLPTPESVSKSPDDDSKPLS